MSDNPYAPPPPSPSNNPFAAPNPYAQPAPYGQANPYGQPPDGNPYGGAYNPYAPPSMHAQQSWATPDYQEMEILADRGTRLGAALIDGFLAAGAMLVGLVGFAVSEEVAIVTMVLAVLAFLSYQWYLIATTGQSLAKKWLGIRIVRLDGSLPGFVHGVVLRVWVMQALGFIPFVGGIIGLIDPLMIFGDERRCLHDHIAGTKVVVASS